MDFRFASHDSKPPSVFDRLYKDSAVRSRNFAFFQASRTRVPATPRGRKIEDELLQKAAEAEARKKALREQREREQMMEMRSAPLINETSKMLAAAKKCDIIVKKRTHSPLATSPSKPASLRPTIATASPAFELPAKDPETERPPVLSSLESKTSLRLPTPNKPLSLTADLRKKFAELLVPADDEPTIRPPPTPVKVYTEKQTQSDPKIPLAAFASPVNRETVSALMTDRSPTKRLFYMNSYDRNRYWSRLREEKLAKQREIRENSELSECTFRPVRRPSSRNTSLATLPRSKSQPRSISYSQKYQLKREWKSRASSPQTHPQPST